MVHFRLSYMFLLSLNLLVECGRCDQILSVVRLRRQATSRSGNQYNVLYIDMTTPKFEPIQIKAYTVKQSSYDVVGSLPSCSITLGPSGPGKTFSNTGNDP